MNYCRHFRFQDDEQNPSENGDNPMANQFSCDTDDYYQVKAEQNAQNEFCFLLY